jgi:hypothetical protein
MSVGPGLGLALAALLASTPPVLAQTEILPEARPDADQLVRRMSRYLASLPALAVHTQQTTEVVLSTGQKLQFTAASDIYLRRPDRLRTERQGDKRKVSLYYNGGQVVLFDRIQNAYAVVEAPPTIDGALDALGRRLERAIPPDLEGARAQLERMPPVADLFGENPYAVITDDILDGFYVGRSQVNGVPCHHVALRGRAVDVQLWIEEGPRPLPRKYVVTTKDPRAQPENTVVLSRWNTSPPLEEDLFTFTPPEGARQVDFGSMVRWRP